jgi:hypothetical protein
VVLDSAFQGLAGAGSIGPAIEMTNAYLLARDVSTTGYSGAVLADGELVVASAEIQEYVSGPVVSTATGNTTEVFAGVPVEESPVVLHESNIGNWANVDDFGAVGDGVTDDTEAIQRAMDSGKPAVLFPRSAYTVNGTVDIPSMVRQMDFVYGHTLRADSGREAMFRVTEASDVPLLIQRNVNLGGVFLDHEASRPVVLTDTCTFFVHVGPGHLALMVPWKHQPYDPQSNVWRLYRNTNPQGTPKRVFVNNCLGFAPGGPEARHAVENVHAWCRSVNTEHYDVNFSFRNSRVWVFGFKTEIDRTHFYAGEGTELEVLGGLYYQGGPNNGVPVVISEDSCIRITMSSFAPNNPSDIILKDVRGAEVTLIGRERFPFLMQADTMPVIPLLLNSKGSVAGQASPASQLDQ